MKRKSLIIALSILGVSAVLFSGLNKVNKVNNEPLIVLADGEQELEELRELYKGLLHNIASEDDYTGKALESYRYIISYGESEIDKCTEEGEMEFIVELVRDYIQDVVNETQRIEDERNHEIELETAKAEALRKLRKMSDPSLYHASYIERVNQIIEDYSNAIEIAESVEEVNELLEEALKKLKDVPVADRVDIDEQINKYIAALRKYSNQYGNLYNEEDIKIINKIIDNAVNQLIACSNKEQAKVIYDDAIYKINTENSRLGLNVDTSHLLDEDVDEPEEPAKKKAWLVVTIVEGSILVLGLVGLGLIFILRKKRTAK